MKTYSVLVKGSLSVIALDRRAAEAKTKAMIKVTGLPLNVVHIDLDPTAPNRWEVGMKIEYINDAEWAWSRGTVGMICMLGDLCADRDGSDYQVFWVNPLKKNGKPDKSYTWWTTPKDVRFISEKAGDHYPSSYMEFIKEME